MAQHSKYKLSIEAAHIVTPFSENGLYSSIGNKPAKLNIGHDGKISSWDRDSALNADKLIGSQNCIVGPGFVDLHFHGYGEQGGSRYSEIGSFQNPNYILDKIPSYGTTSCLATLLVPVMSRRFFGIDLDARFKMLRSQLSALVHEDISSVKPRARLLGFHFEGPKINPEICGAIPANSIWKATPRDLPRILGDEEREYKDHCVRIMTVAPEIDFSSNYNFIRSLCDKGIKVALGHSNASLEQTIGAVYAGARHLTHFFNAMSTFSHRSPGIIGAGLIDPKIFNAQEMDLSLEIICDFIHVNPALLDLALDHNHKVAAVSDSVAAPDMKEGTYEFAGQQVTISDGAVRLLKDGKLSGSSLTMLQTFRNLLILGGDNPDIVKIFKITSSNPADILGLTDIGTIKKGSMADLVVLDKNYNLLYTIVNGDIAYKSPLLNEDKVYPCEIISQKKKSHLATGEVVIGLRISAYSLWCGWADSNEIVTVSVKGVNGNPRHKQGYTGREAILDSAAESIAENWKKIKEQGLKLAALGIATSGLVEGTNAVMAMNLPGWKDFDIANELTKRVKLLDASFPENIPVSVENSANAMAMAIAKTKRLRESAGLKKGENFIFIKLGRALGTGVIVNEKPISSISDIPQDYYIHLRQAISNVNSNLPTLLHQTVLINRLIAKGELALMRTCDDLYPDMHLEALVSANGMIHYAREEEKRSGKIYFRREKIRNMFKALARDPYMYENASFDLELSTDDIFSALDDQEENKKHAQIVFERMGKALGSGIYSLATTLDAPIHHVVILPQLENLHRASDILKTSMLSSLVKSGGDKKEWEINFINSEDDLYVLAGASICYD